MKSEQQRRAPVRGLVGLAVAAAASVSASASAQRVEPAEASQVLGALRVEVPASTEGVPMHVEGPEGAPVELRGSAYWASPLYARCVLPCALRLAPGGYFVHGRVNDERWTELVQHTAGGTHLRLRHPSGGRYVGGILLATFGAAALTMSYSLGIAALATAPGDSYNAMMAGIQLTLGTALGLPALVGGIVLARNARVGIASSEALGPAPRASALRLRPLVGLGALGFAGEF